MKYDPLLNIENDADVYPPSEDSILLIESLDISKNESILEIGCGSGIVSIHCAKNGGTVTCGDINPRAVKLTMRNAELNDVVLDVRHTDVYSGICGMFDTVIFNLPYLPVQEDGDLAKAWSGGTDGLGPLPRLLSGASVHLTEGGRVVIVVSSLMDTGRLDDLTSGCRIKVLGELPLFFERLRVLEIRLNR